ncbi:MAG: ROK family protein [Chlorobiota bacterium]
MKNLGIDIGGTSIKYGIVDDTNLISNYEITNQFESVQEFKTSIINLVEDISQKVEFNSIGIAFPGNINNDGTIQSSPNLSYLEGQNIFDVLSNTNYNFRVENDAYLAALAESKTNDLNEYYFVTLGTGIGSTLIRNGELVKSNSGSSGELGHTVLNFKDANDDYRSGIFESYFNNSEFVSRAKSDLKNFPNSVLNSLDSFTPREISDSSKLGDDLSIITIMEMGKILGIGLSSAANLTGIPIFVIGGGISNMTSLLFDTALKTMNKRVIPELKDKVVIRISQNKNFAGIIGAALYTKEIK